jgi:hypothetical protein
MEHDGTKHNRDERFSHHWFRHLLAGALSGHGSKLQCPSVPIPEINRVGYFLRWQFARNVNIFDIMARLTYFDHVAQPKKPGYHCPYEMDAEVWSSH